jgi:hypothetical protein
MPILKRIILALAWLGRQGTRALAASIFIGLAVPPLAAYVKPFIGETVFVLLLFSYLRTDPGAFRGYLRAPGLAIAAALWIMIGTPLLFGSAYAFSGVRETMPSLYTIMILQVAVAPITSSAAFAALVGLDVALSLMTLIIASAVSPVTTVAFSYFFLGAALFSPIELGAKLFIFFAASGVTAYAIRRVLGSERIESNKEAIDGLNVIAVFVFAIAAMDGVPRHVSADPFFALEIFALVVAVTCALAAVSMVVFLRAGPNHALVVALAAAFRNLGVVMAALGASLPDIAWFYFALAQFPIFIMPALLKPIARRFQSPQRP